jgi:hypothetical protein
VYTAGYRVSDRASSAPGVAGWALLEPWLRPNRGPGRPIHLDLHQVVNTLLYCTRTGCKWRLLARERLADAWQAFRMEHPRGAWLNYHYHAVYGAPDTSVGVLGSSVSGASTMAFSRSNLKRVLEQPIVHRPGATIKPQHPPLPLDRLGRATR